MFCPWRTESISRHHRHFRQTTGLPHLHNYDNQKSPFLLLHYCPTDTTLLLEQAFPLALLAILCLATPAISGDIWRKGHDTSQIDS